MARKPARKTRPTTKSPASKRSLETAGAYIHPLLGPLVPYTPHGKYVDPNVSPRTAKRREAADKLLREKILARSIDALQKAVHGAHCSGRFSGDAEVRIEDLREVLEELNRLRGDADKKRQSAAQVREVERSVERFVAREDAYDRRTRKLNVGSY